jgi:glycosyltransferase involved in cell wall biosynthesis
MSALLKGEYDPSKKAEAVLEYVLEDTSPEKEELRHASASVKDELSRSSVIETQSSRTKSRILFLTRDISVLESTSPLRRHMRTIAGGFDEVHVVVLATIYEARKGVIRDGGNLWLYTTGSKNILDHLFATPRLVREQLLFSDGFRPDVVVSLEPFTAGLVGMYVSAHFGRPHQVHILEDFTTDAFLRTHTYASWRIRIARFVLRRSTSIRVATQKIYEHIHVMVKKDTDLAVLPKFMHVEALMQTQTTPDTPDPFPNFSFVFLFVGTLDAESTLFRAIDAARSVLFSKRVGLAVIGDGPLRPEFEKRAKILGVKEQVMFLKDTGVLSAALEHADLLLCTDTDEASDDVVIQAAARGLPLLVAQNQLRSDLFTDGEDAFLCPKDDTVCFSQKLVKFLNATSLRVQFANNARDIVKTRLHEDPEVFVRAYKDSVERVFEDVPGIKMS